MEHAIEMISFKEIFVETIFMHEVTGMSDIL